MPNIGVEHIKYAVYANNNGSPSYSNGGTLAKAVNVNVQVNMSNDNDFYADDAVAETDRQFTDGTLTIQPDTILQAAAKVLLGLRELALTGNDAIAGVTDSGAAELIYDNSQAAPYLGIGFVIKVKRGGTVMWRAIFLRKVLFNIPADAAETQGKTINWQVPELTAAILRDDSSAQIWKSECTVTTIDQADAYLDARMNITAPASSSGGTT